MSNPVESEFKKLGVKIGDEVEVALFGAIISKVRFVLTNEVCEAGHFPFKTSTGKIEYCHVDHIDKSSIVIIRIGL